MNPYRKILAIVAVIGLAIFLSQVFSGNLILPQFFSIGPVAIHYYGLIMAAALAAGFYFALNRASAHGLSQKQAEDILFWTAIGGFIGARLYHVLSSFTYYENNPADIFKVWNGGLSIYGALIGGLIALFLLRKVYSTQYSVLSLLDWLAPSLLLGQIIGRFGNMFNYEAFGYPANLPWKMFVPENFRPEQYLTNSFFHPWFLYEALGNLLIFGLLYKLFLVKSMPIQKRVGGLFFSYVLLYNLLRFALEYLRIDSVVVGAMRQNAMVSLELVLVSTIALFYIYNKPVKNDSIP